jgi:hypothetical protein
MSSSVPILFDKPNLSHAWACALLQVIDNPGKEISPLVISVTGFKDEGPIEDKNVRAALDVALKRQGEQSISTVANTIFPYSLWRRYGYERQEFYSRYINNFLPRAKAIESNKNSRGLYFERLIAFDGGPYNGNQLEHIILEYKGRSGVRKSMFQASIFDPRRDHTRAAQLPFPCLQHVSFVPDTQEATLTLNAFYATQQLFNKAYGNYLGLCKLGIFMAREMGLTFHRMNCFVGVEKLERIGKESENLAPVIQAARDALSMAPTKRQVV